MLDCLDEPAAAEKPSPFRAQIAALRLGDSLSKAKRLPLTSPDVQDLTGFIKRFRVSIDSEVSKQRKATDREFAVEQAVTLTGNGHVLVAVVVTRVEVPL